MKQRLCAAIAPLAFVALLSFLLCGGCGGGTSSPNGATNMPAQTGAPSSTANRSGRAVFRIAWPAPSRLIPEAAESIEIRVLDGAKVVKRVVVTRAQREVTIEELPAKKLVNVLRAFPNADGSGVAQAEGSAEVEIKPEEDVAVSLTLNSTVDRILLSPESGAFLDTNALLPLTVSPRNAAGEVVLVRPSTLRFVSTSPDVAAVDASGVVKGLKDGTAIIEVRDTESGKTTRYTVNVGLGRILFTDNNSNSAERVGLPTASFTASTEVATNDITDLNGIFVPNTTYAAIHREPENGSSRQRQTRALELRLSPNFPVGATFDFRNSTAANTLGYRESNVNLDANGNQTNTPDRQFDARSGTATFVRQEGNRLTFQFTDAVMVAFSGPGSDSNASGQFILNGTYTFVDEDPSDNNLTFPNDD